jgi:hypothetical protein
LTGSGRDSGYGGRGYEYGGPAFVLPERVVFAWAITPQWQIADDDAEVSEVEVRFTAESPERTLVELAHGHLDCHGEGWEQLPESLTAEGGWTW